MLKRPGSLHRDSSGRVGGCWLLLVEAPPCDPRDAAVPEILKNVKRAFCEFVIVCMLGPRSKIGSSESKLGHFVRPRPLGSPFVAKLAQDARIVSDMSERFQGTMPNHLV